MATEIHLVRSYEQALEVAHGLEVEALAHDIENVLTEYIGNNPSAHDIATSIDVPNMRRFNRDLDLHPDIRYGLMTNNTNVVPADSEVGRGLVDHVVRNTAREGLPYVHKGMIYEDRTLRAKPAGDQGAALIKMMDADPAKTVLIDDQGVKSAGEAAKAGFRAIIVPPAVGRMMLGHTVEHKGVMVGRVVEPAIYRSLETGGQLARVAFRRIAGIDIDQISALVRHDEAA